MVTTQKLVDIFSFSNQTQLNLGVFLRLCTYNSTSQVDGMAKISFLFYNREAQGHESLVPSYHLRV